ncbi:UvrD-helicase domain-containing protein [Yersinia enterocolitica]|uniref:UvrD-helicase domain-containing protein n=1 Tax=Yersinia enterocolitica TaxID=630 RepID=UPI0038BC914D
MIKVKVAGAGAGKTYGLAEDILKRSVEIFPSRKRLYALTYTNTAKEKIRYEIVRQNGEIPKNVTIETVHSFLISEIIIPFSHFSINEVYNKASICFVGSRKEFKAKRIKQLKDNKIIHVDRVFEIAKQVIDNTCSKHKTKSQKEKVKFVGDILSSCIDSIFLDEAQDLDEHALRFFEVISNGEINVFMVGDPKQAIKYTGTFQSLIDKLTIGGVLDTVTFNNFTRRVPKEILVLSNEFCPDVQRQESISKISGKISYIENTNDKYIEFIKSSMDNGCIVCIDKKTGKYLTKKNTKVTFPYDIDLKLGSSYRRNGRDVNLFCLSIVDEFISWKLNGQNAVSKLVSKYNLTLSKSEYAQLYEWDKSIERETNGVIVSSIDSVKGLEADVVIFILTKNTLNYLLKIEFDLNNKFNKEWNKVYVALTRSQRELIFVLDHELLELAHIEFARKALKNMGINHL